MEAICREATVKAIEDALPSEIKGLYKIPPQPTGNLWTVSFNCPHPRCKCYKHLKDRVQKKWTKSSTNPAHAAALAQAVLSKHGKCFDALRCEDCGEQNSVDTAKSLAVAEYVLKNKARKIEHLEVEVHMHPRS